jgi:hypothetical protein
VAVEEGNMKKADDGTTAGAAANDGEPTMVRVTVHSNESLAREKQSRLYGTPQAILRFGNPSSKPIEEANLVLGNDSSDALV